MKWYFFTSCSFFFLGQVIGAPAAAFLRLQHSSEIMILAVT